MIRQIESDRRFEAWRSSRVWFSERRFRTAGAPKPWRARRHLKLLGAETQLDVGDKAFQRGA